MAEERGTLRAIAWQEAFPALRIFSALRMALNFKALVLAAIAVAGMTAGWRTLGQIFADPDNPELARAIQQHNAWPWHRPLSAPGVDEITTPRAWPAESPLLLAWDEMSGPLRQLYGVHPDPYHPYRPAPSFASFGYLLCCALWGLLIWAFFGGAITRLAAVAFARQENVSLGQLAGFVSPRLSAYFVAPLFPIVGTLFMAAFMAALGLLMRAEIGVLLASFVWPLVLLGAFMMAFLLVGLFFGFPLMWGAISAEGTDSFGALSHSYSYTYQRPLQYLLYGAIAAVVGVLGWYLVSLFAVLIIQLGNWGVSWGSGNARIESIYGPVSMGSAADTGAAIIEFWNNCVRTIAFGFVFSYFWSATTVIYFLLRRLIDATELDEVFMPNEDQKHGLPPLKTGPDGVPAVVDEAAAVSDEGE